MDLHADVSTVCTKGHPHSGPHTSRKTPATPSAQVKPQTELYSSASPLFNAITVCLVHLC